MPNKFFVKSVAVPTLLAFLWTNIAAPWAQCSLWNERKAAANSYQKQQIQTSLIFSEISAAPQPSNLTKIQFPFYLPASMGTVVETWAPNRKNPLESSDTQLVIHVQDAHGNYAAQKNLSNILSHLTKQKSLCADGQVIPVYIEGAWKSVYPEWMRLYPDTFIRNQMAELLLKNGRLMGEEYFAVTNTNKQNIKISGIENEDIYKANLQTRRLLAPYRTVILSHLKVLEEKLNEKEKQIYPVALMELENIIQRYESGQIDLGAYSQKIAERINVSNYKNLSKFLQLHAKEKTFSLENVKKQNQQLIKNLAEKLNSEEVSQLVKMSLNYQLGKISAADYYETLTSLAQSQNLSTQGLTEYTNYLKSAQEIDQEVLMEELHQAQRVALGSTLSSIDNKNVKSCIELYRIARLMSLEKKFWSEKFTPSDWVDYNRSLELIPEQKQALSSLEKYCSVPSISRLPKESDLRFLQESYYELAFRRDQVLSQNLLKAIRNQGTSKISVFITGGFHSTRILQELRKSKVAYVVLRPNLQAQEAVTASKSVNVSQVQSNYEQTLRSEFKIARAQNNKEYAQKLEQVFDILKNRLKISEPAKMGQKYVVIGSFKKPGSLENFVLLFTPKKATEKQISSSNLVWQKANEFRHWLDTLRAAPLTNLTPESSLTLLKGLQKLKEFFPNIDVNEFQIVPTSTLLDQNEKITLEFKDSNSAKIWTKKIQEVLHNQAYTLTVSSNKVQISKRTLGDKSGSEFLPLASSLHEFAIRKSFWKRVGLDVILGPLLETGILVAFLVGAYFKVGHYGIWLGLFVISFVLTHILLHKAGAKKYDRKVKNFKKKILFWTIFAIALVTPFIIDSTINTELTFNNLAYMVAAEAGLHILWNLIYTITSTRKDRKINIQANQIENFPMTPTKKKNPLYLSDEQETITADDSTSADILDNPLDAELETFKLDENDFTYPQSMGHFKPLLHDEYQGSFIEGLDYSMDKKQIYLTENDFYDRNLEKEKGFFTWHSTKEKIPTLFRQMLKYKPIIIPLDTKEEDLNFSSLAKGDEYNIHNFQALGFKSTQQYDRWIKEVGTKLFKERILKKFNVVREERPIHNTNDKNETLVPIRSEPIRIYNDTDDDDITATVIPTKTSESPSTTKKSSQEKFNSIPTIINKSAHWALDRNILIKRTYLDRNQNPYEQKARGSQLPSFRFRYLTEDDFSSEYKLPEEFKKALKNHPIQIPLITSFNLTVGYLIRIIKSQDNKITDDSAGYYKIDNWETLGFDSKNSYKHFLDTKTLKRTLIKEIASEIEKRQKELIKENSVQVHSSLPKEFLEKWYIQQMGQNPFKIPGIMEDKSKSVKDSIKEHSAFTTGEFDVKNWKALGWDSQIEYESWLNKQSLTAFTEIVHIARDVPLIFEQTGDHKDGKDDTFTEVDPLRPDAVKIDIAGVSGFEFRNYSGDLSDSIKTELKQSIKKELRLLVKAAKENKNTDVILIPFGTGVFLTRTARSLGIDRTIFDAIKEVVKESIERNDELNFYAPSLILGDLREEGIFTIDGIDALALAQRLKQAGRRPLLINAGDDDWKALLNKTHEPGELAINHTLFMSTSDEYFGLMFAGYHHFSIQAAQKLNRFNIISSYNDKTSIATASSIGSDSAAVNNAIKEIRNLKPAANLDLNLNGVSATVYFYKTEPDQNAGSAFAKWDKNHLQIYILDPDLNLSVALSVLKQLDGQSILQSVQTLLTQKPEDPLLNAVGHELLESLLHRMQADNEFLNQQLSSTNQLEILKDLEKSPKTNNEELRAIQQLFHLFSNSIFKTEKDGTHHVKALTSLLNDETQSLPYLLLPGSEAVSKAQWENLPDWFKDQLLTQKYDGLKSVYERELALQKILQTLHQELPWITKLIKILSYSGVLSSAGKLPQLVHRILLLTSSQIINSVLQQEKPNGSWKDQVSSIINEVQGLKTKYAKELNQNSVVVVDGRNSNKSLTRFYSTLTKELNSKNGIRVLLLLNNEQSIPKELENIEAVRGIQFLRKETEGSLFVFTTNPEDFSKQDSICNLSVLLDPSKDVVLTKKAGLFFELAADKLSAKMDSNGTVRISGVKMMSATENFEKALAVAAAVAVSQ